MSEKIEDKDTKDTIENKESQEPLESKKSLKAIISEYISEHQKLVGRVITAAAIVIMITLLISGNKSSQGNVASTEPTDTASQNQTLSTDDKITDMEDDFESSAGNESLSSGKNTGDDKTDSVDDSHDVGNADENSKKNVDKVVSGKKKLSDIDGFDLIGKEYSQVKDIPGEAIDNRLRCTYYFKSCGATAYYNDKTKKITALSIGTNPDDSDKSNSVASAYTNEEPDYQLPILGIDLGDGVLQAKKALNDNGIDIIDLNDNLFICAFILDGNKKITYEVRVASENERVIFISLEGKTK